MRRPPRGQAVAEAALGMLVLVTILVFAIHLAEVGYLSLKVQESAVAALWDSTQGAVHQMPSLADPNGDFDTGPTVAAARGEAQSRYNDFDGRTFTVRSDSVTNVFTQANGLQVQCDKGGPDWDVPFPLAVVGIGSGSVSLLRDGGGASCTASATLDAWAFPNRFQESGDGYFRVQHRAFASPMTICAMGRAWDGSCRGTFSLMLDDWSFSHGMESVDCTIVWGVPSQCLNSQYLYTAGLMYRTTGLLSFVPEGAASRMAKTIVGDSPITNAGALSGVGGGLGGGIVGGGLDLMGLIFGKDEDAFWMSATNGIEGHVQLNYLWPHDGLPTIAFPVTPGSASVPVLFAPPGYMAAAGNRDRCFLGKACD